ncbi:hypothetical protein OB905_06770 [Halobacteria archaeon AArc-dxtr1]|nr:hypothetical protein [Halobacteria archaeon AArc-dxtr1]
MSDSSRAPDGSPGPGRDGRGRTDRFRHDDPLSRVDGGGRRTATVRNVTITAAGVWVVVSTGVYGASAAVLLSVVCAGIAVALVGAYNAYRLTSGAPPSSGVTALAGILGLGLLGSTAVFSLDAGLTWSVLGAGLLVAVVAGYDFHEGRRHRPVRTRTGSYDRSPRR